MPAIEKRLVPLVGILLMLLLVAGCGSDDAETDGSKSLGDYDQIVKATVTGDDSATLDCRGTQEVGIGYLPGPPPGKAGLFTLSCQTHSDGRTVAVVIGPVAPLTFVGGTTLEGNADFVTGDGPDAQSYDSITNTAYYDDSADGSKSTAHMTLSQAVKLDSGSRFLKRYHLAGTFDYTVAYGPRPISAACQQEQIQAVATGRRVPPMPPLNPEVCGARQVHVTGSFDIVQDFMKMPT